MHRIEDGFLNRAALQALLNNDVGNDLCIRRGVEDGAPGLQLVPQLCSVGQAAVDRQGHGTLLMVDQQGLGVGAALHVLRGIPAVTDGHLALLDLLQHIAGEDLGDHAVLAILAHHAVGVDADAAAVLAAVLQGVQRMVGGAHHARSLFAVNTEHAALVVGLVHLLVDLLCIKPKLVLHVRFTLSCGFPQCQAANVPAPSPGGMFAFWFIR